MVTVQAYKTNPCRFKNVQHFSFQPRCFTTSFTSLSYYLLEAPQSQHTSLPLIFFTSPTMALVSSRTMLFSPSFWSSLKALFSASSLLFWSTETHLKQKIHTSRSKKGHNNYISQIWHYKQIIIFKKKSRGLLKILSSSWNLKN